MPRAFRPWRAVFDEVEIDIGAQEVDVTSVVQGADRNHGRPVMTTISRARLEEWLRILSAADDL
jgi:hypothetical protein